MVDAYGSTRIIIRIQFQAVAELPAIRKAGGKLPEREFLLCRGRDVGA